MHRVDLLGSRFTIKGALKYVSFLRADDDDVAQEGRWRPQVEGGVVLLS